MNKTTITLFLYLVTTSVYSQLKHFTTDEGLPSNRVYGVTVDNEGFLWCSTDKGIAMYDGKEFTLFTTDNGLPINDIYRIIPTKDGKMWYFGKSSQLGYIQNGVVRKFPCADGSIMNPSAFMIFDNEIGFNDRFGSYYLFNDQQWVKAELDQKTVQKIYTNKNTVNFSNGIFNVNISIDGNELKHYTNKGELVKKFAINQPNWSLRDWYQTVFFENNLFCFLNTHFLYVYNYLTKELSTISVEHFEDKENFIHTTFFKENDGIGIRNSSGKYLIQGNKLIKSFRSDSSLFNKKIIGSYKDYGGNLWGNTRNDGIYKISTSINTKRTFSDESIQRIEIFHDSLFAAVENKGLFYISFDLRKTEKIPLYATEHPAIYHYYYQLSNKHDSILDIVTSTHHLNYVNGLVVDQCFEQPNHSLSGGGKVSFVYNDTLVYATSHDLCIADLTTKKSLKHIPLSGIYAIQKYKSNILLGSNSGLYILANDKMYQHAMLKNIPIKSFAIWKNKLVAGTDGFGIYFVDNENVFRVDYFKNLVINEVYADADDKLWISSSLGAHVIAVNNSKVTVRSVLASHGLISNQINSIRNKNDLTYFATDKGMCALNINKIDFNSKPNISIRKIILNDSIYEPSDKDIVLLSNGDNAVSVEFDIAFLGEHEQLKTYYKIEPLHNNWHELKANEINYRGLSPGKYTMSFKVVGYNNNIDIRQINFTVNPRWFEMKWVRGLILTVCMFIFILVVILVSIKVNRNIRRKYAIKKKMTEIELDALRSKLNPHFIFNTLNSIQYYITENDFKSSEKYLLLFSNHLRKMFEYSHKDKLILETEIQLIQDYLKLEMMRFEGKINFEIIIDPKLDLHNTLIPSMLLQPFVENAIRHGLLPKKNNAKLTIEFIYFSRRSYRIVIMDNGKGMQPKLELRKSSTNIIDERINLLNQSEEWIIEKNISNLDNQLIDKGTVIRIDIQYTA